MGPTIGGKWNGTYQIQGAGSGEIIAIKASIRQDGDSVVLRTSLPEEGKLLTGTINDDGEMRMTDAFDGELWTTHSQPATETFIDLDDFRFDLDDDAIAVMILTR